MKARRWAETAAAGILAAWRLFAAAENLWRDWILPTAALWCCWIWLPKEHRSRTLILVAAVTLLLLVYLYVQAPYALRAFGIVTT